MNTATKISAYALALAATFGAAYGVGGVVTPVGAARPADHAHDGDGPGDRQAPHKKNPQEGGSDHDTPPAGLQTAEGGYRLDLLTPRISAGDPALLRFTVRGPGDRPLTRYRQEHGKALHLVLASRDLGEFRHLHPTRADDGTWSVRTTLPETGSYRLFADFTPGKRGARNLTLGTDLSVTGGEYRPTPLPRQSRTARTDGYQVRLAGELRPGQESSLRLRVTRDGRPVTDLAPYLGAYGHLVALRAGDLAYSHVHPEGSPGDGRTRPGPEIAFVTTTPSAGTYRLFLEFRHEGKVRTVGFTLEARDTGGEQEEEHSGGGHSAGTGSGDGHSGGHDGH